MSGLVAVVVVRRAEFVRICGFRIRQFAYQAIMRIISGSAGGIPIAVPRTVLRPTADRVREAVFSILGSRVDGAAENP